MQEDLCYDKSIFPSHDRIRINISGQITKRVALTEPGGGRGLPLPPKTTLLKKISINFYFLEEPPCLQCGHKLKKLKRRKIINKHYNVTVEIHHQSFLWEKIYNHRYL